MSDGQEQRSAQGVEALDRKFWIALVLYGILGAAIWFTLGDGTTIVFGRQVEIRWIPLFVIGTFAFRTVMAREAEKIRRGSGAGRL
jgi:hypothetical protein